ncbi:MAG: hypothetical protein H6603_09550 [Flavobacteriales bacterium]|nr:hypothetical protein [Flavobacteriales bacterium]MCB9205206.1 hypothetical protein [Flavobacteriales bacterium]
MEELPIVLFAGLLILLTYWITYHQLKVWRYRYFYGYEREINDYLVQNRLEFILSRHPNTNDWEDGCFSKPAAYKVSISIVRINGIPITWTDYKYLIIETLDSNSKSVKLWLEIETSYFHKPVLTFKKAKPRSKFFKPPDIKADKNVAIVSDVCPACGWKLNGDETECPECELHFQ